MLAPFELLNLLPMPGNKHISMSPNTMAKMFMYIIEHYYCITNVQLPIIKLIY